MRPLPIHEIATADGIHRYTATAKLVELIATTDQPVVLSLIANELNRRNSVMGAAVLALAG